MQTAPGSAPERSHPLLELLAKASCSSAELLGGPSSQVLLRDGCVSIIWAYCHRGFAKIQAEDSFNVYHVKYL